MMFETPVFQENLVLFGHAQAPRLIAFELAGDAEIRAYRRDADGKVSAELQPFRPFALLASTDLLAGWPGTAEIESLAGSGLYRFLALFRGWREALDARAHLQRLAPRAEEAATPFLFFGDPIQQALTLSGQTHFLELPFAELRRLQLAVAAYCAEGPRRAPHGRRTGSRPSPSPTAPAGRRSSPGASWARRRCCGSCSGSCASATRTSSRATVSSGATSPTWRPALSGTV